MLFVFGYRANKIRSKKISVLIHKSDQYPDLNSCTVAVHFQKIIDTGVSILKYWNNTKFISKMSRDFMHYYIYWEVWKFVA